MIYLNSRRLTTQLKRRGERQRSPCQRGCLSEKPGPTPSVGLNELLDHGLYILHALLQALLQVGLSVYIFFHDRARRGFLKECIEQRCTSLHFPKSRVVPVSYTHLTLPTNREV